MDKILKGNIYTDIIWLGIGIVGGIYFYSVGKYWPCGVLFFMALLYLLKIIKDIVDKNR